MTTIVIRLDLEIVGRTVAEVEIDLLGQLRRAVAPVLGAEVGKVAAGVEAGACTACGRPRRGRGRERRTIVGLFGTITVTRQRAECASCRITAYPADDVLGLEPQERYTLGVAEAALWLAADGSYAKSAASMRKLLDAPISANQVHRLAQREGELVQAAWEQLRHAVFDQGNRQALAELEAAAPVKDLVIVQADGTFVSNRAGSQMEAKAGIVYSRKAWVSKGRVLITDKRTYAGVEEGAAFGEKLVLLAAQQGAFKAKRLWFVSDEALDLRRLRRQHFPTAVYFLDLWHLEKRIREALGAEGADQVGGLLTLAVRGDVEVSSPN